HPPGPPLDHLYREPGARLPDTAGGAEHFSGVVSVQPPDPRSLRRGVADDGDPRPRRAGDHICPVADNRPPDDDGTIKQSPVPSPQSPVHGQQSVPSRQSTVIAFFTSP